MGEFLNHFYPRSPCGERPPPYNLMIHQTKISIHALLAESDIVLSIQPTRKLEFLSTLSLRRATLFNRILFRLLIISIHALLAESDRINARYTNRLVAFLSTLSLRRATKPKALKSRRMVISIHALLAESDMAGRITSKGTKISIHALLAESDVMHALEFAYPMLFLSTLSLRRATAASVTPTASRANFYPRSPCGERPEKSGK